MPDEWKSQLPGRGPMQCPSMSLPSLGPHHCLVLRKWSKQIRYGWVLRQEATSHLVGKDSKALGPLLLALPAQISPTSFHPPPNSLNLPCVLGTATLKLKLTYSWWLALLAGHIAKACILPLPVSQYDPQCDSFTHSLVFLSQKIPSNSKLSWFSRAIQNC